MKVKEESAKVGLKLSIQKTKIIASGPITSWEIDGETVRDLIWGTPKSLQMVTAAMKLKDTCSLASVAAAPGLSSCGVWALGLTGFSRCNAQS